jgi:hypothetical protein
MKQNLILSFVLVLLLIGTYFFQEVRNSKAFEASLVKDHLIAPEKINSLAWDGVDAVKRDDQWWADRELLSHNLFKQIEKKVSNLKVIKKLEGFNHNYFTNKTEFKVNGEKWILGDLTLDRQGFYLAKGGEVMVAIIDGESGEVTDDESKLMELKLQDLRKAIASKLEGLKETQLFRFYPKLPFGSVTIEAESRPSYEINFLNNETLPAPMMGVYVHDNLVQKFYSLVTQLTIKNEVPLSERLKGSRLGKMIFQKDSEKVTWELWKAGNMTADAYVIDPQRKRAWQMVGGTLKVFFTNLQDYWDKKVIPPPSFNHFSQLEATFSQDDKSTEVVIINAEPLKFETALGKIDTKKLNILFQYLFNLSEKDQGERVSQLAKSEKKEILSGSHLRVDVRGQDLLIWRKQEELIVVNLTQGYKVHFMLPDESFRGTYEDMIK